MKNCGFGHEGHCCCECNYQLKIHVCGCSNCSKVKGYICTMGEEDGICIHKESIHGCCECFTQKEER